MSRRAKSPRTILHIPASDIWFLVLADSEGSTNKISEVPISDLRDTRLVNPEGLIVGGVVKIQLTFYSDSVFASAEIAIHTAEGPDREFRIGRLCIVPSCTFDQIRSARQ
jgi:hypothetical protein